MWTTVLTEEFLASSKRHTIFNTLNGVTDTSNFQYVVREVASKYK